MMKVNRYISIVIFVLILWLPLGMNLIGWDEDPDAKQVEVPKLTFKQTDSAVGIKEITRGLYKDIMMYKDGIDGYFLETYPLKDISFTSYRDIQREVFGADPIPKKVVEGREGWMFLGNSYSEVITESIGLELFPPGYLKHIKKTVSDREKWLASKNVAYYMAIAPNKHSVYGEYLPIKYRDTISKKKQLLELLSDDHRIIDMAKDFSEYKKGDKLFYKTNTHWTDIGAYWGYYNLMLEIKKGFPEVQILPISAVEREVKTTNSEDLTRMLRIEVGEEVIQLVNNNKQSIGLEKQLPVPDYYKSNPSTYEYRYKSDVNDLKVLMLGDSFSTALRQFLRESFGEIVILRSYTLSESIIEKEAPDILIHQFVERGVDMLPVTRK
ncbi:MAG: hypothetical protein KJO05_05060 [Bacteroidia bacterium]|nr:hypothetical protein [Bacteroidia bacterium]NNF30806.1 hypothetical protein [Flavobacteriaceae bacterium]MBT8277149.1 hypothetical protein [Bacteroidia bacterium]NNJ80856.1 hypothetical protein [Flavobacteriaceae bacterium]NNK55614.1 hypothetical protein [Flavobacteriaceae bacterium]